MTRTLRPYLLSLLLAPVGASAQMTVDVSMTPAELVQNILLGQGVVVSNISYNGVPSPATPQDGSGSFTTVPGSFEIGQGLILSSAFATSVPGSEPGINSDWTDTGSDADLLTIIAELLQNDPWATPSSNDRAVLEFDFVPTGDSLKFNYIFASEEYPGFNCSPNFNDVFGFFLSGPGINGPFTNNAENIALVPGTNLPVSMANIHGPEGSGCAPANEEYYIHNEGGNTIIFGGYTTVLTARAEVICGETYHIKLAICDAGDSGYDSAVFLEAGSFAATTTVIPSLSTGSVSVNDSIMYEGCGLIPFAFVRTGDTTYSDTVNITVTGTAVAGVDYGPGLPTQLIFPPGDTVVPWPLTIPLDNDGGLETMIITIEQNVVCSGQIVESTFTFYIGQPPPLEAQIDDIDGLCGQSHSLAPVITGGTGEHEIQWSTGSQNGIIEVSPGVTTTYYFTVTDTCSVVPLQDSITITIPVYPALEVDAGGDIAIPCLGTAPITATPTGGNGTYTYLWTSNGEELGTTATIEVPAGPPTWYAVTVGEGCGTTSTDSLLVTTVPLPEIEVADWDTTVFCPGDTVTLVPHDVTGGNGVYTYTWSSANGTVVATGPSLVVPVNVHQLHVLTVNDQCGYEGEAHLFTRLPDREPFVLSITADTTICIGEDIDLQAIVTGGSGIYTLDWAGEAHTDPLFNYAGLQTRSFTVNATDACGEMVSRTMEVEVQAPAAEILARSVGEDDWLLEAATVPSDPRRIRWGLGDSTMSRERTFLYSYENLLDHWVHLRIITQAGCTASDSILLQPPGSIFFPNAFTPDGDGINELFGPMGQGIDQFLMRIYDRSGRMLFETEDVTRQWDGTASGKVLPVGVYVVHYKMNTRHRGEIEGYSHVTLLRGDQPE